MTNHLIFSKINETTLLNWTDINTKPPYREIDCLRAIDQYRAEPDKLTHTAVSTLHTMLVYHRLMRHHETDHLSDKLLNIAKAYDQKLPMIDTLTQIKQFYRVFQDIKTLDIADFTLRETDFDQLKLKKMTLLKAEINRFFELTRHVSIYQSGKEEPLHKIFTELKNVLVELEATLDEGIDLIDNRRTGVKTSSINEHVRHVHELINQFYDAFPSIFNAEIKRSPLEKLESMVGLEHVKRYMRQYYHYLKYQQDRKSIGFQMIDEPGLHMIITGNPGTGKTTIARLLAEIYHELGLLESEKVIEVNRSHLVGSFVGQSEENTMAYIREAVGGVLFIDEAYSLHRQNQSGSDYGQSVIDTLVSAMTSGEYAGKFAVILAGYPEEMRQFLWANPGLRSRFPEQNFIQLPDFKMDELLEIAEEAALHNDYFFTETALNGFYGLIERAKVDDSFGNARTVRDLVMKAIFKKGASISVDEQDDWLDHMHIESKDLAVMDDEQDDTDPMEQLENLIGLTHVKDEVKKLSSFVKIQQTRKNQGLPSVPIQLHAVFSGNPGTGKTTVAKIYSKLLKERGLLKRGHFILASRSDLVAGYVGQTAIKTKNKIREALGGVLFIDEAYSLYRGENDFGKEAIDTLVDEMTKHNENLVVILAGYKQDMKRFIDSNPGLSSRFKKYFVFQDYSGDDLLDISLFHIERYHYQVNEEVKDYLLEQFTDQSITGNARFVVNLVEEAIQFQALRLSDADELTETFTELSVQDFKNAWQQVKGSVDE